MREALPMGTVQEVHQYARQLLNQKRNAEAIAIFQQNAQRHPNVYTTNIGLALAYAATGDTKRAMQYAKAAQPQAPDDLNRKAVAQLIDRLSTGQPVN